MRALIGRDEMRRRLRGHPAAGDLPGWLDGAALVMTAAQVSALAARACQRDWQGRPAGALVIHRTLARGVLHFGAQRWAGEWWIDQRGEILADGPYPPLVDPDAEADMVLTCAQIVALDAQLAGENVQLTQTAGGRLDWRSGERSGSLTR